IGGKRGATWGAVLGGAAGYAYGSHVANEKAKYARQEDWLNACIASARKVNRHTRAYNAKLSRKIADTRKMVRLYKQKKISKSQLRAQKRLVDNERKRANKMLKNAEYELRAQQGVLRDAKRMGKKAEARRLEKEIAAMKKENRALKSQTNTLASLSVLTAV
ncbi:hypothetical protein, partial [Sulfurovum sp.]|uniref:hypothetical protein n=1 Tax=Sulfurovum sp. TaxID=1969726 RepID=UPI0025E741A8